MNLIRTCTKKHYCRRDHFNRVRADLKPEHPGYEYRYEVWDTQANLRPDWDDPTCNEVCEFQTDDKSLAEAFIRQGAQRCELRENGICLVCDMYDARKAAVKDGEARPFYIVVTGITRYCYSAAEGGCWDDWTTIHEVRRAFTVQEGIRQLRKMKDKYPQPRFNRYSAAGGEDMEFTLCYGEDDPRWPKETTERAVYS